MFFYYPQGPWDQDQFGELLTKWIVATDQPFDTVDNPEFRELMSYIHHPAPAIHIPGHHASYENGGRWDRGNQENVCGMSQH